MRLGYRDNLSLVRPFAAKALDDFGEALANIRRRHCRIPSFPLGLPNVLSGWQGEERLGRIG